MTKGDVMELDPKEQSASQMGAERVAAVTPAQGEIGGSPATGEPPCPTCAGAPGPMPVSYVYAIGRVEAWFPRLSVEKEFA